VGIRWPWRACFNELEKFREPGGRVERKVSGVLGPEAVEACTRGSPCLEHIKDFLWCDGVIVEGHRLWKMVLVMREKLTYELKAIGILVIVLVPALVESNV